MVCQEVPMMEAKQLAIFPIFADIDSVRLEQIAAAGRILPMNPSEILFRMNEPAHFLYGVLEGEVSLTLTFVEKKVKTEIKYEEAIHSKTEVLEREIEVDSVGVGELFGWSSMINQGRWTSTASCARAGQVFSLPTDVLKAHCEADTAMGYRLMGRLNEIIATRLQHRTERLIEAWGEAFEVGRM
jgi:CRP-like cAMP-binding protein